MNDPISAEAFLASPNCAGDSVLKASEAGELVRPLISSLGVLSGEAFSADRPAKESLLALDVEGSSSLIRRRLGLSLGTNIFPSEITDALVTLPGVDACKLLDAKNSAGLLLSLEADVPLLGRNFPP